MSQEGKKEMQGQDWQGGYRDGHSSQASRPYFNLGVHDSSRDTPFTDQQYGHLLNQGMSFATSPITNREFKARIVALVENHLKTLHDKKQQPTAVATPLVTDPIVPPLTPKDTGLFPSDAVRTYTACVSSWIELGSKNPFIASISRQVLNLELAYANFCNVKTIIIPGPPLSTGEAGAFDLALYARAIQEGLLIASRVSLLLRIPMCQEQDTAEEDTLSRLVSQPAPQKEISRDEEDCFNAWEAWHQTRSVCSYNTRLFVALQLPGKVPDQALVDRWFPEPIQLLVLKPQAFFTNNTGLPRLTRYHKNMIFTYMRLRTPPWLLLDGLIPGVSAINQSGFFINAAVPKLTDGEFPTLKQAHDQSKLPTVAIANGGMDGKRHVAYLRFLESQQAPLSRIEQQISAYSDWLQSPLQPLSDNLESMIYEVFEGDPVKYNQYETAITQALGEWREKGLPTSSSSGAVVLAVAGSGRGPLVTRALKASEASGVPIEVWAVEKNPDAYVYLLRQNENIWGDQVTVVKTDMRAWKGPLVSGTSHRDPVYGKVDILVSELLGSFGDNELSPECLDGIQHVLARPHGISIPKTYTAHLSPISTPRIHADLMSRLPSEPKAFDTPWVVRLHHIEQLARHVPGRNRYQQAWEFTHPMPDETLKAIEARRSGGVIGGGGGSMYGAAGANDHNCRYSQLTFVCPVGGVTHGLAGYFESTLYESSIEGRPKVELSIVPDQIDKKSKDMISWFPLFFPLKHPLYFPNDTELAVSIWRQTDDTKVWYEWLVDAHVWVGPKTKIKVSSSGLCSSRNVACLL